jgi:hypothetical protein
MDYAQALRKHGVERYMPKEGDAFDHDMHNAMFDVPLPPNSGDTGPGSIAMLIKVRLAAKVDDTAAGDETGGLVCLLMMWNLVHHAHVEQHTTECCVCGAEWLHLERAGGSPSGCCDVSRTSIELRVG